MGLINDVTKFLRRSDFRGECARGGVALGIGSGVERGLRFVKNIILARLLAPDQFGLIAIVVVISAALEAFAEVGVRQSIIHNKKGAEAEYLNVSWWFQTLRGIVLFIMAFAAAPFISRFYERPELLPLMRMSFIAIILNGLISPRAYVLEKNLQFGKSVFLVQGSGLLSTFLTIGLAFYIRNVWALVIGLVAEAFIKFLLSFILCPFRPRFTIHRESLNELLKFAHGMFGMPILTLLTFRADVIILGKMVITSQLGIYYMALSLAQIPFEIFDRIVSPVLLPAFAKKQNDTTVVRNAVLNITRVIALLGLPLMALQILCAGPALALAYPSEYAVAASTFAWMSVYLLTRAQGIVLGQVFMGLGHPQLHRRFVALRAVLLLAFIYPAVKLMGISGAALVLALSSLIALYMQVVWVGRLINIRFSEYIYRWLPGLQLSLVVLVPVGLLVLFDIGSDVFKVIAGIILYLGTFAFVFHSLRHHLKELKHESGYESGTKLETSYDVETQSV